MRRTYDLDSRLLKDGVVFETEVLGRCKVSYNGYLAYKPAREQAAKNQPTRKSQVIKEIEQVFEKNAGSKIKFFTAVGSALDLYHGVDGWFEFNGEVVTIDITRNLEKVFAKADIVIQPEDLKNVPLLAARIAREFITKMEKRS